MLREQRYQLFSESYSGGGEVFSDDADIFSESAIGNAINKLKELIGKIIKKITDFFASFNKNKKNLKANPNAEVDKKEVGKLKKFTSAVKRIAGMSLKNLSNFVKTHKKTAAFLFLTTVSVGTLVVVSKKKQIEHNYYVKSYKDNLKIAEEFEKQDTLLKTSLEELNKKARELDETREVAFKAYKNGEADLDSVNRIDKRISETLEEKDNIKVQLLANKNISKNHKISMSYLNQDVTDIDKTYTFLMCMTKTIASVVTIIQNGIKTLFHKSE